MPKPTHHEEEMTVEGMGDFPLDMLRYERATFATEKDAGLAGTRTDRRKIRLKRFFRQWGSEPTHQRWLSFGWKIVVED